MSVISVSMFCGCLLGLMGGADTISARPQCRNSAPPFTTTYTRTLCAEYVSLGCCTDAAASQLLDRYEDILDKLPSAVRNKCAPFAREVLCQACSPYAAHVYSRDEAHAGVNFPGLCPAYCRRLFDQCKPLVRLLAAGNAGLLASLESSDTFCEAVSISDMDFCYPDLLKNEVLEKQVHASSENCICMQHFASGLKNPLMLRSPADDTGRVFVLEQQGTALIFDVNGTRLPEPFFDFTASVKISAGVANELGFLGLVFHPKFRDNGRFFVVYTSQTDGNNHTIRLSELRVSTNDTNRADNSFEKVILEVQQPFANHNGGEILFGTDGYMYVFLGDGGGKGDPQDNAQNKSVLLGKVLRIDVDSGSPYGIPPDNPFVDDDTARPEIYAYGIRNMWRADVDEGDPVTGKGRGRIFCGEAGESKYEEVNILKKGGNYGWSGKEGYECFKEKHCHNIEQEVLPIYVYNHTMGKAIVGGHMYRGCRNPSMMGRFIFADFMGPLFNLTEHPYSGQWTGERLNICKKEVCAAAGLSVYETRFILSVGEDAAGEMYVLTTDMPRPDYPYGKIYKFVQPFRLVFSNVV